MKSIVRNLEIGGFSIKAFKSINETVSYVRDLKTILIAVNGFKLTEGDKIKEIINNNVGYFDGEGAIIANWIQNSCYPIKISGCDLWLEILKDNLDKNIAIIGASEIVINQTVIKIKELFPNLNVVMFRNGFFDNTELDEIASQLIESNAEVIYLAQGTPIQEYNMNYLFSKHQALYMGVGGSLDVFTNKVKRAPNIIIWFKLEWLYRMILQKKHIDFHKIYKYYKFLRIHN